LDHKDLEDHKDLKDSKVIREYRVLKVYKVLMAHKEQLVTLDHRDPKVSKVSKVLQDHLMLLKQQIQLLLEHTILYLSVKLV